MSAPKNWLINDEAISYIEKVSRRESDVAVALRELTSNHKEAVMQISPEEGQFLSFLIKLIGAKKTLEVGVFTGYSTLVVAEALPKDGKIIAMDVSEEFTNVAKDFWKKGGVEDKIKLTLAPASETMDKLIKNSESGTFDFAFIDADKVNYDTYYEQCLKLVRKGGIIAIDNTLWSGKPWKNDDNDESTVAIRKLNEKISKDKRVDICMLPMADGITLCRVL
eukprot:gene4171-7481_t